MVVLGVLTISAVAPCFSTAVAAAAPQRPATSGDVSFDTLRTDAERARSGGDLQRAIGLYREAVAARPSGVEDHWYLGTLYYETERYAEYRDSFGRVVRMQSDNGAAWPFKGL